jgi:hypothetical protein
MIAALEREEVIGWRDIQRMTLPTVGMADNYVVRGVSRRTSRGGLSSRKPTKTV